MYRKTERLAILIVVFITYSYSLEKRVGKQSQSSLSKFFCLSICILSTLTFVFSEEINQHPVKMSLQQLIFPVYICVLTPSFSKTVMMYLYISFSKLVSKQLMCCSGS